MTILVCSCWVVSPEEENLEEDANAICALETDEEDWRQLIIDYLEHGKLPSDPRHKTEIRRRASCFCIITECSIDALFLAFGYDAWTVSYTHLTLPTNREV